MSSPPPSPPSKSSSPSTNGDARDTLPHGPDVVVGATNKEPKPSSLSLVQAMEAADSIRKAFLKRSDPKETEQMVPPGTWQGVAAFAAAGLLMAPFRRSILTLTRGPGPFQGFVDLVITPVMAVGAAQVGLVIGTLYGSSYYLDRLAMDAATTTMTSSHLGSNELMSVRRLDGDGKISYSPTTEKLAAERETTVAELCREVLSMFPSSETNTQTTSHQAIEREISSFGSWDPRLKTMKSLLLAVENCRKRES